MPESPTLAHVHEDRYGHWTTEVFNYADPPRNVLETDREAFSQGGTWLLLVRSWWTTNSSLPYGIGSGYDPSSVHVRVLKRTFQAVGSSTVVSENILLGSAGYRASSYETDNWQYEFLGVVSLDILDTLAFSVFTDAEAPGYTVSVDFHNTEILAIRLSGLDSNHWRYAEYNAVDSFTGLYPTQNLLSLSMPNPSLSDTGTDTFLAIASCGARKQEIVAGDRQYGFRVEATNTGLTNVVGPDTKYGFPKLATVLSRDLPMLQMCVFQAAPLATPTISLKGGIFDSGAEKGFYTYPRLFVLDLDALAGYSVGRHTYTQQVPPQDSYVYIPNAVTRPTYPTTDGAVVALGQAQWLTPVVTSGSQFYKAPTLQFLSSLGPTISNPDPVWPAQDADDAGEKISFTVADWSYDYTKFTPFSSNKALLTHAAILPQVGDSFYDNGLYLAGSSQGTFTPGSENWGYFIEKHWASFRLQKAIPEYTGSSAVEAGAGVTDGAGEFDPPVYTGAALLRSSSFEAVVAGSYAKPRSRSDGRSTCGSVFVNAGTQNAILSVDKASGSTTALREALVSDTGGRMVTLPSPLSCGGTIVYSADTQLRRMDYSGDQDKALSLTPNGRLRGLAYDSTRGYIWACQANRLVWFDPATGSSGTGLTMANNSLLYDVTYAADIDTTFVIWSQPDGLLRITRRNLATGAWGHVYSYTHPDITGVLFPPTSQVGHGNATITYDPNTKLVWFAHRAAAGTHGAQRLGHLNPAVAGSEAILGAPWDDYRVSTLRFSSVDELFYITGQPATDDDTDSYLWTAVSPAGALTTLLHYAATVEQRLQSAIPCGPIDSLVLPGACLTATGTAENPTTTGSAAIVHSAAQSVGVASYSYIEATGAGSLIVAAPVLNAETCSDVFVLDSGNSRVLRYDYETDSSTPIKTGITTVQQGIAYDATNDWVFYCDGGNIRKVRSDATGDALVLTPASAPRCLAVDPIDGRVYFVTGDATVNSCDYSGGTVQTVLALASPDYIESIVFNPSANRIGVLATDGAGWLYLRTVGINGTGLQTLVSYYNPPDPTPVALAYSALEDSYHFATNVAGASRALSVPAGGGATTARYYASTFIEDIQIASDGNWLWMATDTAYADGPALLRGKRSDGTVGLFDIVEEVEPFGAAVVSAHFALCNVSRRAGTFVPPTVRGTGSAVVAGSFELAGAGTAARPTYAATGDIQAAAAQLDGDGGNSLPFYVGTSAAIAAPAASEAAGTYPNAIYVGSAAASLTAFDINASTPCDYVYWTEYWNGAVCRDGTDTVFGREELWTGTPPYYLGDVEVASSGQVFGTFRLTSDPGGLGKLWVAESPGAARIQLTANLDTPWGVAVDYPDRTVYWAQTDGIWKKGSIPDPAGTEAEVVSIPGAKLTGLEIDLVSRRLYAVDPGYYYTGTSPGTVGKVYSVNLDGTGLAEIMLGLDAPTDVAFDIRYDKIYVGERGTGTIWRADTDGGNVEVVLTGISQLGMLAFDRYAGHLYFGCMSATEGTMSVDRVDRDGGNRVSVAQAGAESLMLAGVAVCVPAPATYLEYVYTGSAEMLASGFLLDAVGDFSGSSVGTGIATAAAPRLWAAGYYAHTGHMAAAASACYVVASGFYSDSSDCDFGISNYGRQQIAVDQPQGGANYPFIEPSDNLEELIGDFYLNYADDDCSVALPLRIKWLAGFGCDPVQDPTKRPHNRDMLIVDANDAVIFDSRNADSYVETEWGDHLLVMEWVKTAGRSTEADYQVLRVVMFTAWPEDMTGLTWLRYFEPTDARLDVRATAPIPRQVRTLAVVTNPLDEAADIAIPAGKNVIFRSGYNMAISTSALDTGGDGSEFGSNVRFDAVPGEGIGKYPCTAEQYCYRINDAEADEAGAIIIDTTGCYRLERPIRTEEETDPGPTVDCPAEALLPPTYSFIGDGCCCMTPAPEDGTFCERMMDAIHNGGTVAITYSFVKPGTLCGDDLAGGIYPAVLAQDYTDLSGAGAVDNTAFKAEIAAAFTEWKVLFESVFPNLTIDFVDLGDETGTSVPSTPYEMPYALPHFENLGDIRISMHQVDGTLGILAFAYGPEGKLGEQGSVAGDVHFDANEDWRVDGAADATSFSIRYIMAHELGHIFGLGHDSSAESLMYPYAGYDLNLLEKFPGGLVTSCKERRALQALFYKPPETVVPSGEFPTVQVVPNTWKISNDCGPCCECQDFINVYEGIRKLSAKYDELGLRAEAVREQYRFNKERWEAEGACRAENRLKIAMQAMSDCRVAIGFGLCNGTDQPLKDIELRACFVYGPDDTGLEAATSILGCPVCNTTYRVGNNAPGVARPSRREPYALAGAWPRYSAYFDCIDPGQVGAVTSTFWFPGCSNGSTVELVVRAFGVDTGNAKPVGDSVSLLLEIESDCCDSVSDPLMDVEVGSLCDIDELGSF